MDRQARLLIACVSVGLGLSCGCGDRASQEKAQKDAAKKARDKELLVLDYPAASAALPGSIEIVYDGANDRTTMTLKLDSLRISGGPATSATLHLSSGHKGRVRAPDNPEGSADGSFIVVTTSPGILAYSGTPGTVAIDGNTLPLREASGKERYSSAKTAGGREEVRFRFPTEAMVAASKTSGFSLTFGSLRVDLSGPALADFREFVARMNPKR